MKKKKEKKRKHQVEIPNGYFHYNIDDEGSLVFVDVISTVSEQPTSNNTTNRQHHAQRHSRPIQAGDYVVLDFSGDVCKHDWAAIAANPRAMHLPALPLDRFRTIYRQAINQIVSSEATPVLLALPTLLPQRYFDFVTQEIDREAVLQWLSGDVCSLSSRHEQYNSIICEEASMQAIPLIDISSLLLKHRNTDDYYAPDGIHPNTKGHTLIAETVAQSGVMPAELKRIAQ